MTEEDDSLLLKFLEDFIEKTGHDSTPEEMKEEILNGERNLADIARMYRGE